VPGVLLAGGNETDDRDGDRKSDDDHQRRYVLKRVAYALAGMGVASLRCDARGGSGHLRTVEELVADAAAGLAALGREAKIDKARLGYFGIDEAAVVAPRVWKTAVVKAIVMLGPKARTTQDWWLSIAEHRARAQGHDQASIDIILEIERKLFAAVIAGDPIPEDTPAQLAKLFNATYDYAHSFLPYDPSAAAAKIQKTAVLLADTTFGDTRNEDYDGYDDVSELKKVLRKATGKKKNIVETRLYPLVDGWFRERFDGDPEDEASWWAPVSETLVSDIADFLWRQLR
jgi:hypothetical protein